MIVYVILIFSILMNSDLNPFSLTSYFLHIESPDYPVGTKKSAYGATGSTSRRSHRFSSIFLLSIISLKNEVFLAYQNSLESPNAFLNINLYRNA